MCIYGICVYYIVKTFTNRFLPILLSPTPQGIVGNLASGKSALVHRYLTGTYVQEESPEGKRIYQLASPPFSVQNSIPESK